MQSARSSRLAYVQAAHLFLRSTTTTASSSGEHIRVHTHRKKKEKKEEEGKKEIKAAKQ